MMQNRTRPQFAVLVLAAGLAAGPGGRAAFSGRFVDPSAAALSSNLVKNGGFERGKAMPAWWRRHPARDNGRNRHLRDTRVFHSGHASARIDWFDPIAGKNKAPLQWNHYRLSVRPGSALIVSGFARTRGVPCAGAGIHFYDALGRHVGFYPIPGPGNCRNWAPFCAQAPVPDRAVSAGFVLYARKGGTTWYDDVIVLSVPAYTARRGTPTLDGRLDDPCWTANSAITEFMRHDGSGPAREPTRAWVVYDDKALYFAFDCPFPAGRRLKAEATTHDGRTWLDDSVEVFLRPWRLQSGYYQWCINCLGKVRDSFGRRIRWESGAVARVHRGRNRWTVEVRIPFDRLALTPDSGDEWGLNLVRNDRINGETVTWSLGGFHDPSRFGVLRIHLDLRPWVRAALARNLADLKRRLAQARREAAAVRLNPTAARKTARRIQDIGKSLAGLDASLRTSESARRLSLQDFMDRAKTAAAAIQAVRRTLIETLFRAGPPEKPARFRLVPAYSMVKVPRKLPFEAAWITPEISLEAARDESESFQLVLIPGPAGVHRVSVTPDALSAADGRGRIPIEWNRVQYIETAPPRAYRPRYVGWWPDVLAPPAQNFEAPAGRACPLWFRVNVPPTATPGVYHANVVVTGDGHAVTVPVTLTVHDFRLPRPGTLPCAFGLYAGVLAQWYHGRKPYQQTMPPEIFARWCRFMGQYRLTPKNIGNEYRRRTKHGWDLTALTKTIGALAPKYYPPYSFGIYRLPCSRDVQSGKTTQDPRAWVRTIRQISREYLRLGLPRRAYIYGIDEPQVQGYPFLEKVYGMLRKEVPEFPIMQTVNHQPPKQLAGLVGIWCPLSAVLESHYDFFSRRLAAGDRLWMYVCCGPRPPYANFFVDQPGIDHRVLFWQAWQKHVTGLLYWCVCWWRGIPGPPSGKPGFPGTPVRLQQADTYRNLGVNGDGILLWPGPNMTPWPSQRLEIIRDGIEDYEYLALLRRCVRRASQADIRKRVPADVLDAAKALLAVPAEISRSFTNFTQDPAVILARRAKIAAAIERFRHALGPAFPEKP